MGSCSPCKMIAHLWRMSNYFKWNVVLRSFLESTWATTIHYEQGATKVLRLLFSSVAIYWSLSVLHITDCFKIPARPGILHLALVHRNQMNCKNLGIVCAACSLIWELLISPGLKIAAVTNVTETAKITVQKCLNMHTYAPLSYSQSLSYWTAA